MSKKVVHFCPEGRPWKPDGKGGWERMTLEEAQAMLRSGATKAKKPYDPKQGF